MEDLLCKNNLQKSTTSLSSLWHYFGLVVDVELSPNYPRYLFTFSLVACLIGWDVFEQVLDVLGDKVGY